MSLESKEKAKKRLKSDESEDTLSTSSKGGKGKKKIFRSPQNWSCFLRGEIGNNRSVDGEIERRLDTSWYMLASFDPFAKAGRVYSNYAGGIRSFSGHEKGFSMLKIKRDDKVVLLEKDYRSLVFKGYILLAKEDETSGVGNNESDEMFGSSSYSYTPSLPPSSSSSSSSSSSTSPSSSSSSSSLPSNLPFGLSGTADSITTFSSEDFLDPMHPSDSLRSLWDDFSSDDSPDLTSHRLNKKKKGVRDGTHRSKRRGFPNPRDALIGYLPRRIILFGESLPDAIQNTTPSLFWSILKTLDHYLNDRAYPRQTYIRDGNENTLHFLFILLQMSADLLLSHYSAAISNWKKEGGKKGQELGKKGEKGVGEGEKEKEMGKEKEERSEEEEGSEEDGGELSKKEPTSKEAANLAPAHGSRRSGRLLQKEKAELLNEVFRLDREEVEGEGEVEGDIGRGSGRGKGRGRGRGRGKKGKMSKQEGAERRAKQTAKREEEKRRKEEERRRYFWSHGLTYALSICARLFQIEIYSDLSVSPDQMKEMMKWFLQWLSRLYQMPVDAQFCLTPFLAMAVSEIEGVFGVMLQTLSPKELIPMFHIWKSVPLPEVEHVVSLYTYYIYESDRSTLGLMPTSYLKNMSQEADRIRDARLLFQYLIQLQNIVLSEGVPQREQGAVIDMVNDVAGEVGKTEMSAPSESDKMEVDIKPEKKMKKKGRKVRGSDEKKEGVTLSLPPTSPSTSSMPNSKRRRVASAAESAECVLPPRRSSRVTVQISRFIESPSAMAGGSGPRTQKRKRPQSEGSVCMKLPMPTSVLEWFSIDLNAETETLQWWKHAVTLPYRIPLWFFFDSNTHDVFFDDFLPSNLFGYIYRIWLVVILYMCDEIPTRMCVTRQVMVHFFKWNMRNLFSILGSAKGRQKVVTLRMLMDLTAMKILVGSKDLLLFLEVMTSPDIQQIAHTNGEVVSNSFTQCFSLLVALAQWTQVRKEEKEEVGEEEEEEEEGEAEGEEGEGSLESSAADISSPSHPTPSASHQTSKTSERIRESDIFRNILAERSDEDALRNVMEVLLFLEIVSKRDSIEDRFAEEAFMRDNTIGEVLVCMVTSVMIISNVYPCVINWAATCRKDGENVQVLTLSFTRTQPLFIFFSHFIPSTQNEPPRVAMEICRELLSDSGLVTILRKKSSDEVGRERKRGDVDIQTSPSSY